LSPPAGPPTQRNRSIVANNEPAAKIIFEFGSTRFQPGVYQGNVIREDLVGVHSSILIVVIG
jgi:hypothetical protein